MAFKKALAQRLFNISKPSTQTLRNCRISFFSVRTQIPPDPNITNLLRDPRNNETFRRFLHMRTVLQPAAISQEIPAFSIGDNLMEKLKSMGIGKDSIRFDGLSSVTENLFDPVPERDNVKEGLAIEDTRKLLKVAQLEMVKSRIREIQKTWIPFSEFVRVCGEGCSDPDQGLGLAKLLDESGTVIVLGNAVFLRPEQVAKAVECLINVPGSNNPYDPRRKELEEMEKQKSVIDAKAKSLVRRELWFGLGFLVFQTASFMRLTFWELSWDVMEPICFYVTSVYFMAGYSFFLRTSKEPSFEGFLQSRFDTKQKRLMKIHNFDIARYEDLRRAFPSSSSSTLHHSLFDNSVKMQFGGLDHSRVLRK